jgi:uncharacterized protein (TIGR00661 family)
LICPLDWGLGHATRCVPVIKGFIDSGANVIIAADNRPLSFLKKEFPLLQFIKFPGYDIRYPEKGSMILKMLFSFPRILSRIKRERKYLQKIIDEHKIDVVVSDNRYGLQNKKVKCIFITHQLTVKCPAWLKIFEHIIFLINKYFIKKFDECWIPDSGELSAKYDRFKNIHFIGIMSRFQNDQIHSSEILKYDVLCILSGPEPQRTVFEKIILEQLKEIKDLKTLIVRGITENESTSEISENIQMVSHLGTHKLAKAIVEAKVVVCRPGYSSIMDIVTLGGKVIFVPTPGQTEQEYLGKYYEERKLFYSASQKKFDLLTSIERSISYSGLKIESNQEILKERIQLLLK